MVDVPSPAGAGAAQRGAVLSPARGADRAPAARQAAAARALVRQPHGRHRAQPAHQE